MKLVILYQQSWDDSRVDFRTCIGGSMLINAGGLPRSIEENGIGRQAKSCISLKVDDKILKWVGRVCSIWTYDSKNLHRQGCRKRFSKKNFVLQ